MDLKVPRLVTPAEQYPRPEGDANSKTPALLASIDDLLRSTPPSRT